MKYWSAGDNTLLARPTVGGPERVVVPCVPAFGYAIGPRGVLHVGCQAGGNPTTSRRSVWLWDEATGRDRQVGTLELQPPGAGFQGLGVSPDGATLLYSTGAFTSTVMMIDNFR